MILAAISDAHRCLVLDAARAIADRPALSLDVLFALALCRVASRHDPYVSQYTAAIIDALPLAAPANHRRY